MNICLFLSPSEPLHSQLKLTRKQWGRKNVCWEPPTPQNSPCQAPPGSTGGASVRDCGMQSKLSSEKKYVIYLLTHLKRAFSRQIAS